MTAKWGSCIFLAVFLALSAGCRTPQPNLKPDKAPENLIPPPPDQKYDTPGYPKAAFDAPTDPSKQAMDPKTMGSGRNSMSAGAPGGLPGR
jgi:hypothetical protein